MQSFIFLSKNTFKFQNKYSFRVWILVVWLGIDRISILLTVKIAITNDTLAEAWGGQTSGAVNPHRTHGPQKKEYCLLGFKIEVRRLI